MIALSGDSCGCGSRRKFSPKEYFQWESQQELRYKYIDGEVFAMGNYFSQCDR